ncbi:MAG TPA: hypothetical protein VJR89_06570 [Polyangiales bacterium]|nr:hypothetical protein [Polyangiales bacterium]
MAVFGVWLAATRGQAQSSASLPDSYLAVKLGLGFAGDLNVDAEGASLRKTNSDMFVNLDPVDATSGLGLSFAGEAAYLFGLHRNIALGPAWGLHTWRSNAAGDAGDGTSLGFELSLVTQARVPLGSRLELYVSLPLGMTFSILNEYKTWTNGPNGDVGSAEDVDPTYGFVFGAYLGMRYAVSGTFGLLTELGYQRYAFTHPVEFRIDESEDPMGIGTTLDLGMVTQQVRWNVGVFF